jgi:hypothetical protein
VSAGLNGCCRGLEEQFGARHAARDLRRFRRRGANRATRLLLRGLEQEGVEGATLLDIGGGVGAIQHGLLAGGAVSSLDVDVSPAYVAAASEEGRRRGTADRMEFRVADFVDVAEEIAPADVVTLDRVVCCYPDMPALVRASASRARRLYGIVVPRDARVLRALASVANLLLRLRRTPFRVHVHPLRSIEAEIRALGLEPAYEASTPIWHSRVYRRSGAARESDAPEGVRKGPAPGR